MNDYSQNENELQYYMYELKDDINLENGGTQHF